MEKKVLITVFTDPMMGLSYESEPIREKLEASFKDKISFDYVMSLLVKDVSDFMIPEEISLGREKGIEVYNKRLAQIYKSEEKIGGLPINMEGFALFSPEYPSSLPLNIAYHAVKIVSPEKAYNFLYNLRRATIVDTRPTTHTEELCAVAEKTGINKNDFLAEFNGNAARKVLELDLKRTRSLGIYGLPAYLVEYNGNSLLLRGLANFDDFVSAISKVSGGELTPSKL